MELNLDLRNQILPKDEVFCSHISSVLKNNKAVQLLREKILHRLKSRIEKFVIPLIKKDFLLERQFKVENGSIGQDGEKMIIEYIEDSKMINIRAYFREIMNETFNDDSIEENSIMSLVSDASVVVIKINSWFEKYMELFDNGIVKAIEKAMIKKHEAKVAMENVLYNFTSDDVPQEIIEIIENGIKGVPKLNTDEDDSINVAVEEIVVHLNTFRRVKQKKGPIIERDVVKWLNKALRDINEDNKDDTEIYKPYYQYVRNNVDKAMNILAISCGNQNEKLSREVLEDRIDVPGAVFNQLDKNYGIALIPVSDMILAEIKMLKEMKGVKIDLEDQQVIKIVEEKIMKFENSLSEPEKEYLNNITINRNYKPEKIKLPFLKLNAKLHKLNKDQIETKQVNKISYRPVQDSSAFIVNQYASILMVLLRDLIQAIKLKHKSITKIESMNGEKIAKRMKSLEFKENGYDYFVSADMSSAYSNIYKQDVFRAITLLTKEIGAEYWKRDLVMKLTELVLSNNYIEASVGIFKLQECLPMGSSCSQDGLNVVGILHELELFEGISKNVKVKTYVNDIFEVEIEVEETSDEKIDKLSDNEKLDLIDFMRYIDDTQAVISTKNYKITKELIMKMSKAYPDHIVLNVSLSLVYFCHLDCVGYKYVSTNKIVTFVRRNFIAPVNIIPFASNCPKSNKYCIILSEMLRYRRICSNVIFVKLNDQLLFNEMLKVGYSRSVLNKEFSKALNYIEIKYNSDTFEKEVDIGDVEDLFYCGKITYDDPTGSHKIIKTLLQGRNILKLKNVIVPQRKMKNILVTRRKHLKKLRGYLDTNNIKFNKS